MENLPKISGRGSRVKRAWEDVGRTGGEAPTPEEVAQYLSGGNKYQMSRRETEQRANEYILSCMEEFQDADTGEIRYRWKKNPTKAGLARAIGVTPETLSRYISNRVNGAAYTDGSIKSIVAPGDFDIIKAACCVIEEFYEGQLGKNRNNSGSIFWLLNAHTERWTNKQEVEMVSSEYNQRPALSQDEIRQIAEQASQTSTAELMEGLPDE